MEELGLPPNTKLIEKEPYKLPNGATYIGQWDPELKNRVGLGMQVWPDGSLYEG